ncbi:hypothetical protein ACF3OB_01210 [Capnocytophaga canis]|uniref:hypothetical protein n=1 Tax=Capnocytophaga canis TaxID=1848903 RepID=UPI00370DD6C4
MTPAENVGKAYMLSEVEKQIRKDIPRLMELREGCLLMKNEKHDNVLKGGEVVKISCLWNDIIQVSPIGEPLSRNYIEHQIKDLFDVIGHDIMLNDVLEWSLMNKIFNIELIHKTLRMKPFKNLLHLNDYGRWDLSKPYLKDQSEELINFLYNLIKQ